MDSVIKSLRDRMTSENSVQIADGDYVRVPAVEIRYALQRITALELELEAVHEQKSGELLENEAFRYEWERGRKLQDELTKVTAERDVLRSGLENIVKTCESLPKKYYGTLDLQIWIYESILKLSPLKKYN